MKKAVFIIMLVITILCLLSDITGLQLLPLILGSTLIGIDVFSEKNLSTWIFVLSVIMFFINMTDPASLVDMAIWVMVGIVFIPKK